MTEVCSVCGYENVDEALYCKHCGRDLGEFGPKQIKAREASRSTVQIGKAAGSGGPEVPKRLAAGGVLLVAAGVLSMLLGAIVPAEVSSGGLSSWIGSNSDLPIMFGFFSLVGGILALLRRLFYIALALSTLGCFAVGPYFISSLLPTIGAILLAISRRDFIPIYTRKPTHLRNCPACGQYLEHAPLYNEYYCYNCKQFRELEPVRVGAGKHERAPQPSADEPEAE